MVTAGKHAGWRRTHLSAIVTRHHFPPNRPAARDAPIIMFVCPYPVSAGVRPMPVMRRLRSPALTGHGSDVYSSRRDVSRHSGARHIGRLSEHFKNTRGECVRHSACCCGMPDVGITSKVREHGIRADLRMFLLDTQPAATSMGAFGEQSGESAPQSRGSLGEVLMDVFQEAAKAAQRSNGDAWCVLSPQEQTRAIYQEMRRIDAELAERLKRPGQHRPRRGGGRSLAA